MTITSPHLRIGLAITAVAPLVLFGAASTAYADDMNPAPAPAPSPEEPLPPGVPWYLDPVAIGQLAPNLAPGLPAGAIEVIDPPVVIQPAPLEPVIHLPRPGTFIGEDGGLYIEIPSTYVPPPDLPHGGYDSSGSPG